APLGRTRPAGPLLRARLRGLGGLAAPGRPRGLRTGLALDRSLPLLLGSFGLIGLRLFLADGLDPAARGSPRAIREGLLAGALLLRFETVVHELQDGGLGRVALTRTQPENAGGAARPVPEPRRDRPDDFLDRG